jgi:hypothetical protein
MFGKKIVVAATALAALTVAGLGAADAAQPRDMARDHRAPVTRHETVRHETVRHETVRHDVRRPYVARNRVYETLRAHRYVGLGNPYFVHGRYVVRSHDRFGHVVLVQVDPWTGRFIGVVRI